MMDVVFDGGFRNPSFEIGMGRDSEPANLYPEGQGMSLSVHFPVSLLVNLTNDNNKLIHFVYEQLKTSGVHITGGNVAISSDGLDSLPGQARTSGFQTSLDHVIIQEYLPHLRYQGLSGTKGNNVTVGGFLEYNHLTAMSASTHKTNMSEICLFMEKDCASIQENVWGTDLLNELENIKEKLDPKSVFQCNNCVGYKN